MGLKKLLFILLMLVMSICGRVNAITAPTGSPTDDKECVVHRATLEHPVEGTGAEAFIRLDHTAEIIFNITTEGQKIQFDCINKGIQDYAYCRVHFGEKHLGNMVLQRKTWQRLSVSESRLTLETVGGALRIQELTLTSGKMDLSKGLVYTVQSKSGGLLLRFCEAGCVYMQTPFENDLYLTQRLETQQDFWIWNANETAKAEVKLTFKMSETSVSHGSLDLNVAKKDVWQQFTLSQSSEADLIQLKDVASGNLISEVAKTERGAEVSFYCDSSDKVYWSLGCDASFSGSSTTLTTVYFSAGAVVLIIVVVVGVHLHHRRFTPAESPSSGTGDSPFETVFLTRIDLPVSTSASGTHQGHAVGETLTGEEPGSIPHAPSRRREVLSQQATQAEVRSPQRRRMRNVEMSMAVPGEERDFSEGNEIDISRGTNGHGARDVNWVGDTDKEVKCTRTPTNTLWNQTATRFPEEIDNPVCLSHGNNTDRDNSVSNTAPQERAQKPGNVRPRRTERMPSDVMRELSGNVLKMAKASAATELKKTPRQSPPLKDSQVMKQKVISPDSQVVNPRSHSKDISDESIYENTLPLPRKLTGGASLDRTRARTPDPLPRTTLQHRQRQERRPEREFLSSPRSPRVNEWSGSLNPRPVNTLPAKSDHRSMFLTTDVGARRAMSNQRINEPNHNLARIVPLTLPIHQQETQTFYQEILPCYSPIILSPAPSMRLPFESGEIYANSVVQTPDDLYDHLGEESS